MILSDKDIKLLNRCEGLIYPFVAHQVTEMQGEYGPVKIPSYGLSAAGYDVRLGDEFVVVGETGNPYRFHSREIELHPGSSILAHTLETIRVPRRICARIEPKSTWARQFLWLMASPLEPGWEGQVTLELFNSGHVPIQLIPGSGIAQIQFYPLSSAPELSYADRSGGKGGKYQGQTGVTLARL